MQTTKEVKVVLKSPYPEQDEIRYSPAKRKIIRAGRRFGKTVIASIMSVDRLLLGGRVLYATPTAEQIDTFWREVKTALRFAIDEGVYKKNESVHTIEKPFSEARIRAKTAWNADTLRGDYADLVIFDEFQLMCEDAWEEVGAPMLLDNDGDAIFIYTPPSLRNRSVTKAKDPRHASKMFLKAKADRTGRWAAFHFDSYKNPYLSQTALDEIKQDMSEAAIRQEILAEDIEEIPGALWTRELISRNRRETYPELVRMVVGIDPPGGVTECGIVTGGVDKNGQIYIVSDSSGRMTPDIWAGKAIETYESNYADVIVAEKNYGGDMVAETLKHACDARNKGVNFKLVTASRGKAIRAEPVVAMYEQNKIHHVGEFPHLEEEMCCWVPGETRESPNRLDGLVWVVTELMPQAVKLYGGHLAPPLRTVYR